MWWDLQGMNTLFYLEKPWLSQYWVIIYDVLDYRKYGVHACIHISMHEKKIRPRKKLGQLHNDSFLLILSPSVPKTVKNEATKSRSGERKGRSPLSKQTLTRAHNLKCGNHLWNRKHRSQSVDGVLRTDGLRDLRAKAQEWLQDVALVSVPTWLSSCPTPGTPRCQRPPCLQHRGCSGQRPP